MPETYRVAIIGRTGRGDYGHGIDTVWLNVPNVEIVGVADDDKAGLSAAASRLKTDRLFADYREMLDKVKPRIVAICPRWVDQHLEMVLAAAERGIHVYMEKPLCRTLAEADAMVSACERSHVKLAVAHTTRYSPRLAAVKKLIAEGRLGKILETRARGKEDATRGGGEDLWVLGSHVLDMTRAMAGPASWCFASVTQGGASLEARHVQEGNEGLGPLAGDAVHAVYGLADGVIGHFDSVRGAAAKVSRFGLTILGTLGAAEIQTGYLPTTKFLDDPSWSPGRTGVAWQDVTSAGIGVPEPISDGDGEAGNLAAVTDLIAAIEEDRRPLCDVVEARGAVEMIAAVFESQRAKAPVAFPLANRENPLRSL